MTETQLVVSWGWEGRHQRGITKVHEKILGEGR